MNSVIMPSGAAGLGSTMARLMSIRNRDTASSCLFYSLFLKGGLIDLLSLSASWISSLILSASLNLFLCSYPSHSRTAYLCIISPADMCVCVIFTLTKLLLLVVSLSLC